MATKVGECEATRDRNRMVPVIAFTASARTQDLTESRRAGFQAHLAKPLIANELVAWGKPGESVAVEGWLSWRVWAGRQVETIGGLTKGLKPRTVPRS
jgi:CheY-like chemotaxis protein